MVEIELKNVSKFYGKIKALENVNLKIKDQEYFIILGPTGAGKTTLLKIIAGLIQPTKGKVYFDGKDVTNVPANDRNLGFVFENYALFPHMNVFQNICYSGRIKDRDPEITKTLADQVLMLTLLKGRNDAKPHELSGGMQQRVALCRALLNLESTGILLLDEPLKALDAGLRMNLRKEIRDMAKSKFLKLTTVHVTNEMEEAMMVADRIAILNKGKIVQIGDPYEIYYRPKNLFVANFMSEINCIKTWCAKSSPYPWKINNKKTKDKFFQKIQSDSMPMPIKINNNQMFVVNVPKALYSNLKDGHEILLIIRANHFKIRLGNRTQQKYNSLLGIIKRRKFMGVFYRFEIAVIEQNNNSINIINQRINSIQKKPLKDNTNNNNKRTNAENIKNINNYTHKNIDEKIIVVSIPATNEVHETLLEGIEVTIYFPKEFGLIFKMPEQEELEEVLNPK
ncbi:MAG: ABC transporter ATP-binding protein [Promethearchaeota archaeon]